MHGIVLAGRPLPPRPQRIEPRHPGSSSASAWPSSRGFHHRRLERPLRVLDRWSTTRVYGAAARVGDEPDLEMVSSTPSAAASGAITADQVRNPSRAAVTCTPSSKPVSTWVLARSPALPRRGDHRERRPGLRIDRPGPGRQRPADGAELAPPRVGLVSGSVDTATARPPAAPRERQPATSTCRLLRRCAKSDP